MPKIPLSQLGLSFNKSRTIKANKKGEMEKFFDNQLDSLKRQYNGQVPMGVIASYSARRRAALEGFT